MSLLRSICYQTETFSTASTRWECNHEKIVRNDYEKYAQYQHSNVKVEDCGLFLSEEYPRLGASPDDFVPCDCCGHGCMEIKCPYYMKDENIREGKCLKKVDGVLKLKTNNPYFYQVQTQMLFSSMDYCEFIVWTDQELFGQRILPCRSQLLSSRLWYCQNLLASTSII